MTALGIMLVLTVITMLIATARFTQARSHQKRLEAEINRLADFIMAEVPGEPGMSEGAVDCAIRIIRGNARG